MLESEETIKKERKNIDDLRNNLAATEALLKSSQASLEDLSLEKISLLAAVKEKDAKVRSLSFIARNFRLGVMGDYFQ